MRTRESLISRLRSGDHPAVLIIGGGINGVGAFRDLALQGVPALLVEAGEAPEAALQRLRAARPCAVETKAQARWASLR